MGLSVFNCFKEGRKIMHCSRCGANIADEEFVCTKCGYLEEIAVVAKLKMAKSKSVENESNHSYPGFWKRCSALILDLLILLSGVALLAVIIGGVIWGMSTISKHQVDFKVIQAFAVGFGAVFSFALNWAYFTGFESSKYQATLGKKMMGLFVADKDGKRISMGQANIRYWSKVISILILFAGFWMIAFTKKKRTLHDFFAGTMVLNKAKH
jgi:uncharacterized RDD family membrane protein YckC